MLDLNAGDKVLNLMECTGFNVGEKITISNIRNFKGTDDYEFIVTNEENVASITLEESEIDCFFDQQVEEYKCTIMKKMNEQMNKGFKKYGNFLSYYDNMPIKDRIDHLQEEIIDELFYAEHIKQKQIDLEKENEQLREENDKLKAKLESIKQKLDEI